ncbi:MAG: exodeoxyribonuclease VII small subunit [Parachlamydiales bacterium]|jgi:exodeoxyribonuclease VII small subunit
MTEEMLFEKAFGRLEEILQKMNEGTVSLDASLKLFEEANILISKCNEKLISAEQKIEVLIKNRNSSLEMEKGVPKTASFEPSKENLLEK